jgi:uncharacterized phiE125 gp8 family phage protein
MINLDGYYQWREAGSITGLPEWSPYPSDMRTTIQPMGLVVDVATIKTALPSPNQVSDDLIRMDIEAVTDQIERYLGRDLLTRTRQAVYFSPGNLVWVMPVPVASITSVQGLDRDGDAETLTLDTDYYVRGYGNNVQIYGIKNPYPYLQVTYQTGYGDYTDVPASIRKAVTQEVFRQFKRRQDPIIASDTTIDSLSAEAQALIRSYIVRRAL